MTESSVALARRPVSSLRVLLKVAEQRPVLAVFSIALLIRAVVVLVVTLIPQAASLALDDTTYSGMAEAVINGTTGSWDDYTAQLYSSSFTFMAPVSLVYFISDGSQMAGQLYVALLGAGTAALATRLALEILPVRWALSAGAVVALLPSQVLWSSLLLKDAAVWVVLAGLAVTLGVAARKTGRAMVLWLLLAAVLLLSLGFLRSHTMVVAAWALGIATFAGVRSQRFRRGALGIAIAIAVPWQAGLGPGGYDFVQNAGSLEYRRAANATGAQSAFVDALGPSLTGEPAPDQLAEIEKAEEVAAEVSAALGEQQKIRSALSKKIARKLKQRQKINQLLVAAAADPSAPGTAADPSEPGSAPSEPAMAAAERRRLELRQERIKERIERARLKAKRAAAATAKLKEKRKLAEQAKENAAKAAEDAVASAQVAEEEEPLDPSLTHLPIGLKVMLLEPVPWESGGSSTLQLARGEALLWYPVLLLAVVGLWQSRKHLSVLGFPLLVGGGILLVYALAEGNIGTAFRHRGEFVWVVALLAAVGMHHIAVWRRGQQKPAETAKV